MKYLHIISFDIPYPANYGGAIDVFYRIKALHDANIKIILHCWHKKDREPQTILENLCEKVYYYNRDTSILNQFGILPYAVLTRKSETLINNLLKDNYPILFEGLVSCYYSNDQRLKNRKKLFRECNVEHDYYYQLGKATTQIKEKIYFYIEAKKLYFYERVLNNMDYILALSHNDEQYFRKTYSKIKTIYLPCAHQNERITTTEGKGNYILYHGNLSVAENEKAALYLCNEIIPALNKYKFIIAGHEPSKILIEKIKTLKNAELKPNPDFKEMQSLIHNAHLHILITYQNTGIKLKLLNTLYAGKHIIVNKDMVSGSGLEDICHIANTTPDIIKECDILMNTPFDRKDIDKRENILNNKYDNIQQSKIIAELI